MEEIIYRKSNKEDLAQITGLLKILDLNISNLIADGFWVAATGDLIVGCARIIEMDDGNIELASVAVVAGFRKRGIGGKLIQALLGREKRLPVYLMCRRKNQEFYEEQGFKEIKDDLLPPVYKAKVGVKRNETKADGLAMIKEI